MFGKEEDKKIEYIPIKKVLANPYQPRKEFTNQSIKRLSDSIKACGIIQPVNVRVRDDGKYELISGERRVRAAKEAGLHYIPAIVSRLTDEESAVAALVENLQRENLNFFDEAEGYFALLTEHGFTQSELAKKIGRSQGTIANKIRLLKLYPRTKELIRKHNLSERHARALLRINEEKYQVRTAEAICEREYSVKKAERIVRETIDRLSDAKAYVFSDSPAQSEFYGSDEYSEAAKNAKNIKIFINTIKETIRLLKLSGVDAKAAQFDRGEYYEFVVRIPKESNKLSGT